MTVFPESAPAGPPASDSAASSPFQATATTTTSADPARSRGSAGAAAGPMRSAAELARSRLRPPTTMA